MITQQFQRFDPAVHRVKEHWRRAAMALSALIVFVWLIPVPTHAALNERSLDSMVKGDWGTIKELVSPDERSGSAIESIALGYACLFTEDYHGAIAAFGRVSSEAKRDITSVVNDAEEIVERYPHSWIAYLLKADVLARAGRYEEALDAANEAVKSNRNSAVVYHIRGLINALSGRDGDALRELDRAIENDSEMADAYVTRGILRLREGEPGMAQRDFEKALEIAPESAVAVNARGVALCQQGRYEEALQAFVFARNLEPEFTAAAANVQAAKDLSRPGRMRTRIAIVAGQRAGALGRRTIAVAVSEEDKGSQATDTAIIAVQGATGLEPLVTVDPDEAAREIAEGERPVVLGVPLSKTAASEIQVLDAFDRIGQKSRDAGVQLITDGPDAAVYTAKALKKYIGDAADGQHGVKGWDMLNFGSEAQDIAGLRELAQTGLYLRSMGVEVRPYVISGSPAMENWMALPSPEKTWLPLVVVPEFGEATGSLPQIAPQIAASWVARPEQSSPSPINSCFCSAPNGDLGVFIPDLSIPGLGPGGVSIPGQGNIWIGTSKLGNTPQIKILTGENQGVQIRFDIDYSHGMQIHINVDPGGHHFFGKDGVELKKDDHVIVRVHNGKVVIEVNGEKATEYQVAEANNDEEIVIERKPDGTTTVTKGNDVIGKVERGSDGSAIIRAGNVEIQVPAVRPENESAKQESSQSRNEAGTGGGGESREWRSGLSEEEEQEIVDDWERELEWLESHGLGWTRKARELKGRLDEYEKKKDGEKGDKPGQGEEGKPDQGGEDKPGTDEQQDGEKNEAHSAMTIPDIPDDGLIADPIPDIPDDGLIADPIPDIPDDGLIADPIPEPIRQPPIHVPPGWIVVPGPDGPTIIPAPQPYVTSVGGTDRMGVYTVDDTNLEVISSEQAGSGLLFGNQRRRITSPDASLQCPFLIFQNIDVEGGMRR